MIVHTYLYQKLKKFESFWVRELNESPCARVKPDRHRQNEFTRYYRAMRELGKIMAKKTDKKTQKFEWKGYVNIHVPEAKVSELEVFASDDKSVFVMYNSMLTTDYQFKQYFDTYTDSIKTVIVCHNTESENYGWALTAYADDWYTSLAVAIFKHQVLSDRDWDSATSKSLRKFG